MLTDAEQGSATIRQELGGLAAVLAIYLVYVGRLFDGSSSFAQFQDNTYLILPIFSHISRVFQAGEYPYWMNTVMGGIPLFNAAQFSALYPLYFLEGGWYQDPLSALRQVHYVVLLHVFLTHVNAYVLARILRIPVIPAVMAASVFALSPDLRSYMVWVNAAPYAWLPLAIGSVVLILEHKRRAMGFALGIVSISALITASASHVFIQLFYIVLILCVFQAFRLVRARRWSVLRGVARDLALTAGVAFLLASPVLIPTMVGMEGMLRWFGNGPPVHGYDRIPFDAFLIGQLEPRQLASALFPSDHRYLLGNPFIGVSSALLALFAVFKARRNPIVIPLAFIGLYGLLSASGSHLGFAYVNYGLPLLDKIREPARHLAPFVLCFAMLAGLGFAYVLEALTGAGRPFRNPRQMVVLIAGLGLAAVSLSLSLPFEASVEGLQLIGCAAVLAVLAIAARFPPARRIAPALVVLIVLHVNLTLFPWKAPNLSDGDYFAAANLRSHEILREISLLPDVREYRLLFGDGMEERSQAWAMNASYYGLRTFNVYFNPLPANQFVEMYYHGADYPNYYEMVGAKYLICKTCDSPLSRRYRLQKDFGDYKLYTTEAALPRYYVAVRLEGRYADRGTYLDLLARESRPAPVVFAESGSKDVAKWVEGAGQVVTLEERHTPNTLTVSVNTEKRGVFVLNEYFTPSWKARVNGLPAPTFKVNLNQIGVLLDRGQSLVEMEYRPTLFVRLLWVRRATLAALIALGVFWLYRRWRSSGTAPEAPALESRTAS